MAIIVFVGTEEELKAGRGRIGLTVAQAAARLQIGDRAFRRLIDAGDISPYEEQLGPIKFFEEPDVEQLKESRRRRY